MSGIVNKVKNALSSDHSSTSTTGTTGTHTTGTHTTGTHTGTAEGVAGPHSSRAANAADPRVDSDLDGSRRVGGTTTGVSPHVGTGGSANSGIYSSNTGAGVTGTHGTHNTHGTTHTGTTGGLAGTHGTTHNTTAGPHSSNLANKADPRVDSDLDGSSRIGGNTGAYSSGTTGSGLTGTHGTHNTHGTTHTGATGGLTGTHGTHNTHGTTHNTTAGPHSSDTANKLDPRVDSDLDGSRRVGGTAGTTGIGGTHASHGTHTGNTGLGGTHAGNTNYTGTHGTTAHTGTHGGISSSTNAGPHDSNLANKADPRVDSDLDGRGNRHGATTTGAGAGVLGAHGSHATAGSGTAQNTAGPHNSDLLNKLDPRVDSDRDGSKTYGGNKTHQ